MKQEHIGHYPYPIIYVEEPAYLKDPLRSELGIKILTEGLTLMADLGYEHFTFKKLAHQINSTEASLYRYFESKHKLLLYYFLFYWHDMENRIAFASANIKSPEKRLNAALKVMIFTPNTESHKPLATGLLKKVITNEYVKVYFCKTVDEENQQGLFQVYKRVCHNLANILQEINPAYRWNIPLISTVMQSIHFQHFYSEHLPSLTHKWKNDNEVFDFFSELILNNINSKLHEAH